MTDVWDHWQEVEKNVEEEPVKETMSRWALENLAVSGETMLYSTATGSRVWMATVCPPELDLGASERKHV